MSASICAYLCMIKKFRFVCLYHGGFLHHGQPGGQDAGLLRCLPGRSVTPGYLHGLQTVLTTRSLWLLLGVAICWHQYWQDENHKDLQIVIAALAQKYVLPAFCKLLWALFLSLTLFSLCLSVSLSKYILQQ